MAIMTTVLGHKFKSLTKTTFKCHHLFINQKSTTYVINAKSTIKHI